MDELPPQTLTDLSAPERLAILKIARCSAKGSGSRVSILSERTKRACLRLFERGLIEIFTDGDGRHWYRTTPAGNALANEARLP